MLPLASAHLHAVDAVGVDAVGVGAGAGAGAGAGVNYTSWNRVLSQWVSNGTLANISLHVVSIWIGFFMLLLLALTPNPNPTKFRSIM